ncbi:hypothetical protein B0H34DRAFT_678986 [Crassisporium funariophilum]|nr:hypothetical protein B0H34DRAFT_678986 [Crassisporium funariophilum]
MSTAKQQHEFVCMSTTVDDLSYTPSEQERSRDAAQFVATGRRSWKTLKGKGEAVWPPLLEAALIEALENYQPDAVGSKSSKNLGRFPMRNRFISDYIFATTGKMRTPKQVGSRLQQLRDTCKGDKILHLISHRHTPEPTSTSSPSEYSGGASPTPPPDSRLPTPKPKPVVVYVMICLQEDLWPAPTPSVHFVNNDTLTPQRIQLAPSPCAPRGRGSGSCTSSVLRSLSGSVEFPSPCALVLQSSFNIYMNGSNSPVHSEIVPLRCISSPMQRSGWLYTSEFAPNFWETLCSSRDLTRFTITQTLKPIRSGQSSDKGEREDSSRPISIIYKFSVPELKLREEPNLSIYSSITPNEPPVSQRQLTGTSNYDSWKSSQYEGVDIGWSQPLPTNYLENPSISMCPSLESSSHASYVSEHQPLQHGAPHSRGYPRYDAHAEAIQPANAYYRDSAPISASWSNTQCAQGLYLQNFGPSYS